MGDADHSKKVKGKYWIKYNWLLKDKYNFALVTKPFPKEEESLRFGDSLKKIKNIENFQVNIGGGFKNIYFIFVFLGFAFYYFLPNSLCECHNFPEK